MKRLERKCVIITGGGTGMGAATARRFAAEGAHVFLVGRRREPLERVASEIAADGAQAAFSAGDVSRGAEVTRMTSEAVEHFAGHLDVLVNNAGTYPSGEFLGLSQSAWNEAVAINLKGVFLMAQAAARHMVEQDGGCIINVSSVNAEVGERYDTVAHYIAAKGGIPALTRQMALELVPHNIRVNCILPGAIDTPMMAGWSEYPEMLDDYITKMIPMRRIGTPEEVAALHTFLASDEASYITGAVIPVDGGMLAV